ncbi:MAG: non-ribosomal peptide synthetase [Pikeienuella sp.]
MTGIAGKLAGLSPEQRALLQRRLAARRPGQGAIPRRGPGPAALSFAQRRLWFMQALNPANTAYNVMTALRLRGSLDEAAMRAAFAALIERHEALRTGFETGPDGEPRQIPAPAPALEMIDLSAGPDPLAAARARLAEITARPHDLSGAPVRAGLIRLGAGDRLLAIGLHHIAADRWSMALITRDLAALYGAACAGAPSPLAPVMLQMPDFAAWQHGSQGAELERQLDWWRGALAGAPALDLPRDRRPAPGSGAPGGVLPFDLPPDLTRAAREAARRAGVSLFTLLLTGFNMLLARYCDAEDVTVGADVGNRERAETQGMVGPLVNTLALRADLSGDPGFAEALRRTEASFRAGLAHQDAPLDQVVEALNPARKPDEMIPLFRAKFDLQQAETLPAAIHGLRLERFPYQDVAAKYELRFNLEDDGERIGGKVEYRADLYEPETIGRMAGHYLRLLAAALAAPETPLSALPMLSAEERATLLALGEGPEPLPHAETLHAAFEAAVDRAPDAVALTHAGGALSYAELDARANAVAALLIARNPPAETRVGICMARSPDLVAAILGVLKAGCAYVPLDPAYPEARLAFIAGDAGAGLVLTDGRRPPFAEGEIELIDVIAAPPAPRPAPRGAGAGLAVIIYTSGSTGRPKGVALEHRNILSRVAWAGEAFAPEDFAGMLFGTSVSFDLSLFEIFATLALGGRLVLAGSLLDLPRLGPEAGVTFVNTVPSLLRELVKHDELPPSVRCVNLAGEFFPPALLDRLKEFPHLKRINNLYGPTEDAIYDAGNPVEDEPERPMPIGRPFPGSRIHILDRSGGLLPRGAAGEICVAGAGLARGYLNRPELTAEKFRPDPFAGGDARLYRSGDRGRWRSDGRIDILGRIDTQVKIRGQRIETGEIENALEALPHIAEAVALATGAPGDTDRQLAAYVAPRPGETAEPEALRAHLAALLPAHMVPSRWLIMPDLPRMPNGKIDRRALPPIAAEEAAPATPPASETERRVIALWSAALGREDIGAEDDFFALGGHSLMAMRLLARLREEFGVTLALGQLFDALTPRRQAALIDEAAGVAEAPADATAGLSDAEVDALLAQMAEEAR